MVRTRRVFALLLAAAAFGAALPASAREIVSFRGYAAGTVVIVTHTRELFYVIGHGQAIRYPVGGFVSHGCIRMHNEDVLDLYRRVPLGSEVFVLR